MSTMTYASPLTAHPETTRIAEQVREAHGSRTPLRISGAGTWLDAGRPTPSDAMRLDVSGARGIIEYVPGDLTLTALAATPLAEIVQETRANGQRLTLDPYGTDAGTLGASVATASAGPLAATFGTPRDLVLGVAFVNGNGQVIRGGGRVVKNVAGFDLVRLVTGAWGTLGVLTEITVRLRALPAVDETVVVPIDAADDRAVATAIATIRALPFTFDAIELLDAGAARAAGVDAGNGALLVRLGGSSDVVRAMRAALTTVGTPRAADAAVWDRLRAHEPPGAATMRLSHLTARAADVWGEARRLAALAGGSAHLSLGRTVARISGPSEAMATAVAAPTRFAGTRIAERLPAAAWASMRLPNADATRTRLAAGIRAAFDPAHILNPGIIADAGAAP